MPRPSLLPLAAMLVLQLAAAAGDEAKQSPTAPTTNQYSFEAQGYERIPLEPNGQNTRWLVPLSLNGKPCKLVLDTGADFIILQSWVAERFEFATEPSNIMVAGAGGARKLVVAEIPVTLGGKTVEKQHVRAMADGDKAPDASTQPPVAGLLGLNALRGLGVVLDIRRHTLWLPKQAGAGIATAMEHIHAAKIPLRHTAKTRHFYLEGNIGQEPLRMVLDTGAENTFLSAARAAALKLPLTDSSILIMGADDSNRSPKQGVLTDVAFGKTVIPQLLVLVIPLEKVLKVISEGESQPLDGILGADVLGAGGGILDLATDTLYLTGNR